jgi:nitrogen fixation NifU-like protein
MSIYSEIILDHYENPRNRGPLAKPTSSCHVANPLCGDKIDMSIKVNNGKVTDIKFEGIGCAISTASASMLTVYAKNRRVADLKKMDQKSMIKLLGIELGVNRIKCALLPLEALHKLL